MTHPHHHHRHHIMKGFLSFLILWIISKRKMTGAEITQELERRRGHRPSPGTIYPVLKYLTENLGIEVAIGDPCVKINIDILKTKEKMPEDDFEEVLEEFKIEPEVLEFKDEGQEVFIKLISEVISVKDKSPEEKQKIIDVIKGFSDKIPEDDPKSEGFKNFLQMLIAVANGEDHKKFKDKVPEEMYSLFEKVYTEMEKTEL